MGFLKKEKGKRKKNSPVSLSVFLTSFLVSSAQDSVMESRKKHNKCLPVTFLMTMMMARIC